jgi:hypothetical protein
MFFRSIVISLFFLISGSILNAQNYTDYKLRTTGVEDPFPSEWTTVDNVLSRASDFMKEVKNDKTPLEQKKIALMRAEHMWDAIDPSFVETVGVNPWNASMVKKYKTISEEIETYKALLFPNDFSYNEEKLRSSILSFLDPSLDNLETKDLVNKFLENIQDWDHNCLEAILQTYYFLVDQVDKSSDNNGEQVYQALLLEIYILDKVQFYRLTSNIDMFDIKNSGIFP